MHCTAQHRTRKRESLLEMDGIDKVAEVNNKSEAIILHKLYNSNFKFSEMDARRKRETHTNTPIVLSTERTYLYVRGRIIRQHPIPANKQRGYKTCRF